MKYKVEDRVSCYCVCEWRPGIVVRVHKCRQSENCLYSATGCCTDGFFVVVRMDSTGRLLHTECHTTPAVRDIDGSPNLIKLRSKGRQLTFGF